MNIITEADFRKELKSGLSGGYLFFGDEDYLKQLDLNAARNQISPDEAFSFFNDLRLDAITFTPDKLLDALMPLPMGAEQKIVTLSGYSLLGLRPSEVEALTDALSALKEYDYNVLILSVPAGAFDPGILPRRPSALLQKLAEYLTPVSFERSTPARLAVWCGKHFEHNGVRIASELCRTFVDYCGTNMYMLAHEVDKVSYYVLCDGRDTVTEADIRYVAIPGTEYDAFAFANALLEGRNTDALTVLSDMKRRRVEPIMALSEISRVFCDLYTVYLCMENGRTAQEIKAQTKMHEYKIGLYQKFSRMAGKEKLLRAVALARDADLSLKRSPVDGYASIERLICAL